MNSIRVGNRNVIFSNIFFVPHGEDAFFSCQVCDGDLLNCNIKFESDDGDLTDEEKLKLKPELEVEFEDDKFLLKFRNFNKSTGFSFSKPFIFAESDDGRNITLLGRIYKLKGMMQMFLQVMLEDKK